MVMMVVTGLTVPIMMVILLLITRGFYVNFYSEFFFIWRIFKPIVMIIPKTIA